MTWRATSARSYPSAMNVWTSPDWKTATWANFQVGSGGCCPPRHPTHFDPRLLSPPPPPPPPPHPPPPPPPLPPPPPHSPLPLLLLLLLLLRSSPPWHPMTWRAISAWPQLPGAPRGRRRRLRGGARRGQGRQGAMSGAETEDVGEHWYIMSTQSG